MEKTEYLTVDEAIAYLKLPSRGALFAMNARREIPFIKLGRRVRYLKADLDAHLSRNRVTTADETGSSGRGRS